MSFTDAVKICFNKYVDFTGRARRSEYWWWVLFTTVLGIVAGLLDQLLGTDYSNSSGGGIVQTITSLAVLLPSLAVLARRLHDTGRSGWWMLIGLIPVIGWIVLLVFTVSDSNPQANQYGPNPKGIGYVDTPGVPQGY
ncbi:DUF805 domain-containing protein [Arsenicicoccus piscis]|uniref:DUF805 domain-containing protein n=1 Tax=Arsenicicoccus piscis TaxID=673954 RepID=A0ABQ6HI58_9MICO|nr:DUF805 domain-containing protein [Arsenicicoccus piscis]MCH8627705.1 DUF805 domain-containing protein [Arsenicicoccus piscis]GMA18211.1 DUF805 domain-containing protein [Arsenicicoccus piscis]